MKVIQQGAEAKIILTESDALTHPNDETNKSNKVVVKARTSKSYRHPDLDKQIRKQRTKAETKLLKKASEIIKIPATINVIGDKTNFAGNPPEYSIKMEYIDGKKLSEHLDNFPLKEQKQIMKLIGTSIAKLHKEDIIHGDLTTSNMIHVPSKKHSKFIKGDDERGANIFFIDFGLGYISRKIEDKAVDLHLLKQALEAKHFKHFKELQDEVFKAYKKEYSEANKIFERITAVERRGRYRH